MNKFGPPEGKETLFRYLTKYMPQFIISSIGGFVYNTFIVLGPIYMGRLIDEAGGGPARQVLLMAGSFIGEAASSSPLVRPSFYHSHGQSLLILRCCSWMS